MSEFYKPSMFNHYTEDYDTNELILFNSYLGMNYLIRVPNKKKDKVIKFFSQPVISKDTIMDDYDLKYLAELGYFVDSTLNEKHLREVLLNKLKADNTLRLVIHTMKLQLSKPHSKRAEALNKVRIMDTRGSEGETCSQPGSKYQGCQNPRGCGCAAC